MPLVWFSQPRSLAACGRSARVLQFKLKSLPFPRRLSLTRVSNEFPLHLACLCVAFDPRFFGVLCYALSFIRGSVPWEWTSHQV
ncbi:hypothetical protein BJX70DRAFT_362824 [Aspergillus crustosus]